MTICTFAAKVRKPRLLESGSEAQLFAFNGPDADGVCKLSLSELQDARVRVDLGGDLGGFDACIRRPKMLTSGVVACFWGEHGADSDAIVALGLSRFADLDVQVTVTLLETPDGAAVASEEPAAPAKPAKPKTPFGSQAAQLWVSGIWGSPKVWQSMPGMFLDPARLGEALAAGETHYTAQRRTGWEFLRAHFGVESVAQLDPARVCELFAAHGLERTLPASYRQ